MVAISDTTCLSTLTRVGELDILPQLFHQILLPQKVHEELLGLSSFGIDIAIFQQLSWLIIQEPSPSPLLSSLLSNRKIDPGEAFAIALAVELQPDWIILDDLNARRVATQLHLNITGLGGILLQAKKTGIIAAVKPLLDNCVQKANFRLAPPIYQKILQMAGE